MICIVTILNRSVTPVDYDFCSYMVPIDRPRPPPPPRLLTDLDYIVQGHCHDRASPPLLSDRANPGNYRRTLDGPDPARPRARRPAEVSGSQAVTVRNQSQHAVGASEDARGQRHRRTALLFRSSAPGGVCHHRQGNGASSGASNAESLGRETYSVGADFAGQG